MDDQISSIREKLNRLARQNRRLRTTIYLGLVVLAVVTTSGAVVRAPAGDIDARRLRIVDEAGKVRILLEVAEDGTAEIVGMDTKDTDRFTLSAHTEKDGASLDLCNAEGNAICGMGAKGTGECGVIFRNAKGVDRAFLGTATEGHAGLFLRDDSGERLKMISSMDGRSSLRMYGREGEMLGLEISRIGNSMLFLENGKDQARCQLTMSRDGSSTVDLSDAPAHRRTVLFSSADGHVGLSAAAKSSEINLNTKPDGSSHIFISEPEARVSLRPARSPHGEGGLQVTDWGLPVRVAPTKSLP